ncbi:nucleotidyl transferase AbiEii/AbiGii toxin family protein [Candidatus Pacearchaeota archaeon]|nr:nucleotidyl transferase AbiEii/AbiGii toxin family protein [Candidatus Pacearchaeota archaeon]
MIPKELLVMIARKKGLTNKEHMEKDYFQDLFLYKLYKKTNMLVFKGGTCLYKIYNLKRFSEDLDFSLLKYFDVESLIKGIIKSIGNCEIKSIKKTEDSLLIKISFIGILTNYNTLRIDINFKNIILEDFDTKNYISDYTDINPFSVRAMNLKEMLAEKIHSLLAREKARDLFDLFFLLKLAEFDKKLVEKKLRNFNMKFDCKTLKNKISKLKNVWERELKPFVLTELPEFEVIKNFVLSKIEAGIKE